VGKIDHRRIEQGDIFIVCLCVNVKGHLKVTAHKREVVVDQSRNDNCVGEIIFLGDIHSKNLEKVKWEQKWKKKGGEEVGGGGESVISLEGREELERMKHWSHLLHQPMRLQTDQNSQDLRPTRDVILQSFLNLKKKKKKGEEEVINHSHKRSSRTYLGE
jgi:hypothetical protein